MRILQLSNKSPFPPAEGGPMAMHAVITGLMRLGHRVDILTMDTPKFTSSGVPGQLLAAGGFEAVPVDSSVRPTAAFLNLASGLPYHASRFLSERYRSALARRLGDTDYDLVQLEGIFPAIYLDEIRRLSRAPVVLRAHNIEHRIWDRVRKNTHNPLLRAYLGLQAARLRKWETSIWQQVDGIVAITPADADDIRPHTTAPVTGIPFGIDIAPRGSEDKPANPPVLYHLGSMDWMPNAEGIRWFIQEVMPLLAEHHPRLRLRLAGRSFPAWLMSLDHDQVEVVGEVDDAGDFIRGCDILIVPLLSGSGMRIKIIEAMAAGKAVVSTRIGAEGIMATEGRDILYADTAEAFLGQVGRLSDSPELLEGLGRNARDLVAREYSIEGSAARFLDFYASLGVTEGKEG